MKRIKILLIEDEMVLAQIIKETLETRDFEIAIAANGVEGWTKYYADRPDICVVDIMMPRKDGLSLVTDIRKINEDIPIIFLTAKAQTADVLKGLEAGADDYIKKPFSMEELILRIKRLVRKVHAENTSPVVNPFTGTYIGQYNLNHTRLELNYENETFNLSQREADLLQLLLEHKNTLLTRRIALLKIWGDDSQFHSRTMDVYITRLRKYLKHDPSIQILNIRGQGYKLIE